MDESWNLTGMSKKVGERSVTRLASQALLLYFSTPIHHTLDEF